VTRPAARALVLVAAACAAAPALAAAARPDPARFLTWSRPHRVVHLVLLAGLGSENDGFNFDGYGRGELLVRIPLGWRVAVDCENRGAVRHSCAVVRGSLSTVPAFRGAATARPEEGLSPGARASFSFVASRTGTFRIACLVPGHEQARMWDVLDVVRDRAPVISARPGP
jgi:hypothetical protein